MYSCSIGAYVGPGIDAPGWESSPRKCRRLLRAGKPHSVQKPRAEKIRRVTLTPVPAIVMVAGVMGA